MDHGCWDIITREKDVTVRRHGQNPPGTYECYYQNIADALAKSARLVISAEWSRRPIHILDLACRSAKLGKSLPAKYV
jgi:hypothetical protein